MRNRPLDPEDAGQARRGPIACSMGETAKCLRVARAHVCGHRLPELAYQVEWALVTVEAIARW